MSDNGDLPVHKPNEHAIDSPHEHATEQTYRVWHEGRWFYSIADMIGSLTGAKLPRNYWSDLKRRLAQDEGFAKLYASCVRLKVRAPNGKLRETDCADAETLLRIIQSIPSPKAEPIKQWLARVGTERLAELEDPSLAVDRARALYKEQGYSDQWIETRLQSIVQRQELTDEWHERGAVEGREFAILTDTIHRGAFAVSTAEHKVIKQLKRQHNLRDSMTSIELALTILAEATTTELHQAHDSQGFEALQTDARQAGGIAGATREQIEQQSGRPVVSAENYKTLTGQPTPQRLPFPDAEE